MARRVTFRGKERGSVAFMVVLLSLSLTTSIGIAAVLVDGGNYDGGGLVTPNTSLNASILGDIGGCCTNGVCVETNLAGCPSPGIFLGVGSTCFAGVMREQGGTTIPLTNPNHNCCEQTHTYGDCCEDTPYCAGDPSDSASCTAGNIGSNCGILLCENYTFDLVCSAVGGDGDCGDGAVVGSVCGMGGTCQVPCSGAAGDNCSSTPFCSGVLGNPPCPLVCSEPGGDCSGAAHSAFCGAAGICEIAALGSTCFGAGVCTQSTCVQPTCEFCVAPIDHVLDTLNAPTAICSNTGGGCDAGNANGGICDCPDNAGVCNFVCFDGATPGAVCSLATVALDCGVGATCGVLMGSPVETCSAELPRLAVTISGTRPFKDDPQATGLSHVYDFDDGDTCTIDPNDPGIYEVFEITDFSRVTIDLCCNSPAFTMPNFVLFETCQCLDLDTISPNLGQGGIEGTGLFGYSDNKADILCDTDLNLSMTFDLPPGRYVYPINSNRFCIWSGATCDSVTDCPSGDTCTGQAERDYQLHFSAIKAQRAACCDGVSCSVTTKLECEGNDQLPDASPYFPGGPNTVVVGGHWLGSQGPEDAIVGTPVADCATAVCSLGACCGSGIGVASCDDTPNGGVAGDGIDETTCSTRTGGVGDYHGGVRCSDYPCPVCTLDNNTSCQIDFASISDASDRHHATRAADDFIPQASTINRICWSGVWGGAGASSACNDNPPDSVWYLTIYGDDGNGIPDPNNIVVGPELPIAHDGRTITNLQPAFKPTSYSAPVSITGLTAGDCYWIEILGEGTGDLGSSDYCQWNWLRTDTSSGGQGNQEPSQDGNGWSVHVFANHPSPYTEFHLVKNDRAFCIDSGIVKNTIGNEGVDGGCGDKTGTFACCYRNDAGDVVCTSAVSLFECILHPADDGLSGVAFVGVTCPDAGGTYVCGPPANDDCVTGAAIIPESSCTEVTNIGNCAKNKSSWCSPLFSFCSGVDNLCIPILDDNNVESTTQFDCEIQPTDNRFATTDGPPFMDNPSVTDDCSGSPSFQADVWYQVVSPCNGQMSVTMCGGGLYDAMLAAYTACPNGNDPFAPTLLECNDDSCGTFNTVSELVPFDVAIGQEVTIRVGGFNSSHPVVGLLNSQGVSSIHVRFACGACPLLGKPGFLFGEALFSKDRYISIDPATNGSQLVAIRVTREGGGDKFLDCTSIENKGTDGFIAKLIDGPLPPPGDPTYYCSLSGMSSGLHMTGCSILPGNTYNVAMTTDGINFSDSSACGNANFTIKTTPPQSEIGRQFGDLVGGLVGGVWTAPDNLVTASDIVAVVQRFTLVPTAPLLARMDTDGAVPNGIVNGSDILRSVKGFAGDPFGFGVTNCLTGTCVPPQGGACE